MLADGQAREAVGYFEEVSIWNRCYPDEHPSRLESQHELARAYLSNVQIKQVVELLEHVVAVEERTLDKEDPDRLESQHKLTNVKQLYLKKRSKREERR